VKNSLVGDQHSLWRKYREMILAVKISQENTKADILADYLNAIYFGVVPTASRPPARPTSARMSRASPRPRARCWPG